MAMHHSKCPDKNKQTLFYNMNLIQFLLVFIVPIYVYALKFATYNIWNQMFTWKIRKLHITDNIKFNKIDIVALQEVRGGGLPSSTSQISELRSVLPGKYRWSVYQPANNVTPILNSSSTEYLHEGIGLISSLEIVSTFVRPLKHDKLDPDKNRRVLLHAILRLSTGKMINVIVLHLSYHKQQQCKNIAEVISYIKENNLKDLVIMGDLNTYKDYEGPVNLLTEGTLTTNPCRKVLRGNEGTNFVGMIDVWQHVHPNDPGLTFSNMPFPGMQSRPDRILVSKSFQVKTAFLLGHHKEYMEHYRTTLLVERFLTVVKSSSRSHEGVKGYNCDHDCGPRGSCQCGVCVNQTRRDCLLQNCSHCGKTMYTNLVLYSFICLLLFLHLLYAIFALLIIGSNSYGDAVYSILGFSCCLFSKDLFTSRVKTYKRKYQILHVFRIWPLFRLPIYVQLLVYLTAFGALYFRFRIVFEPALGITYNIMEEEMFPSDHLMLTVELEI